uniref:Uncharacterized protein n=1 Tax=Populus davidiana TaxID=266767 RepID=A0A6M2F7X6_9ROSI
MMTRALQVHTTNDMFRKILHLAVIILKAMQLKGQLLISMENLVKSCKINHQIAQTSVEQQSFKMEMMDLLKILPKRYINHQEQAVMNLMKKQSCQLFSKEDDSKLLQRTLI